MDTSPGAGALLRKPVSAMQEALRDGIDRYKALKHSPESRRFLAGATGAYVGRRFITIGLIALSYRLGDGVLGVGVMFAVQIFPSLFLQPFAGVLVDRYPGRRLFVICQILLAAITLSYLALLAIPSLWVLLALTFAFGTIQTVEMPAMEVRLMSLTHRDRRGTANAVQTLSITVGEIVGPGIAGVILAVSGSASLFVMSATIYVLFAWLSATLPDKVEGATSGEAEPNEQPTITRPGYLSLLRRKDVPLYMGLVASTYLLYYGILPLYIVRAIELGRGEASIGMFYAAAGIGAFVGGVLAGMGAYTSRRALVVAGFAAIGASIASILFGIAGVMFIAIISLVLTGLSFDVEEISSLTFFQNRLPENLYGRFFSVFMMANGIGGLVGALVGPLLAGKIGTSAAIAVMAMPTLVFGVLLAVRAGGVRWPIPLLQRSPGSEPDVAGHGLILAYAPDDLRARRQRGRPILVPKSHRLA